MYGTNLEVKDERPLSMIGAKQTKARLLEKIHKLVPNTGYEA